ncbi:MAG: 3-keto-disaccharide hydrolase [Thermoguttaceae bacterium]|jgi:hypothetical protein
MAVKNKISQAFLIVAALATVSSVSCKRDSNVVIIEDPTTSAVAIQTEPATTANEESQSAVDTGVDFVLENLYDVSETIDLFNGQNLDGWTNETGGEPEGWIVKNEALCLVDPDNGGDIITKDVFDNYVFSFEWRFGLECNSGVKYKIEQPNGKGWVGLEYQVQDDAHVEDGKIDNRKIASLFDVLAAKESTRASEYPAPTEAAPSGKFRGGKIVVAGLHVEHWLDDECVLAFEIGSDEWSAAKAKSKFRNQKNFGLVESSPLLLQCHGYPVEFRNLKLQKLTPKAGQ